MQFGNERSYVRSICAVCENTSGRDANIQFIF